MAIIAQQAIQQDQIKLRWQEPYVSAALNNKNYKTVPRGVYRGFVVTPSTDPFKPKTIVVGTGGTAGITGYEAGNYDPASLKGWSVAVCEDYDGRSATIIMQDGVNSDYEFDCTASAGQAIYVVLSVQYMLGFPTAGQIKVVEATDLDADPTLVVLAKVEVPPGMAAITLSNIITNDPLYPVVYPFANEFKFGYMSKTQANILDVLSSVPSGASPTWECEFQVLINGPQVITIPPVSDVYTVGGNDLLVFRNGIKSYRGRDYNEIDRGDGKGVQISWIGSTLRTDDRITFRGQMYAASLTNTLTVQDEGALVSNNVTRLNFVGNGVLALPDGAGRVRVIIPTAGVGGGSATKQKINSTLATIPQATVVYLLPDGSIVPCDPKIIGHRPYGITSGAIPPGEYGTVIVSGFAINALLGFGGISTGDVLYVSSSGNGDLASVPPDPFLSYVWKFGIADCADGTASSSPVDVSIQIQQLC